MLQGAGFHPVSVNKGSLHLEARTGIENLLMLQDALCQARWRLSGIVKVRAKTGLRGHLRQPPLYPPVLPQSFLSHSDWNLPLPGQQSGMGSWQPLG